jgi:hypothetical protein
MDKPCHYKPLNVFLSLPDHLMRIVFEYENSIYRDILKTLLFKEEILAKWWLINTKSCRMMLEEYIKDAFLRKYWKVSRNFVNEYVKITSDTYSKGFDDRVICNTMEEFMIYFHPLERGLLKFKILPAGATKRNCEFLRNPMLFDGFFQRKDICKREYDISCESIRNNLTGYANCYPNINNDVIMWIWLESVYYA